MFKKQRVQGFKERRELGQHQKSQSLTIFKRGAINFLGDLYIEAGILGIPEIFVMMIF
jgi:hypothetical protein